MRCPKCGYITFDHLKQCKRCGTEWEAGRSPSPVSTEEKQSVPAVELFLDDEFDQLYQRLKREEQRTDQARWGGFFRRAAALIVDIWILAVLSLMLFYFAYVSFNVGLAAHQRQLSGGNLGFFLRLLFVAWVFLVTAYFVLLHGMEGRTIGKWLLGLRVVGAQDQPISYGQALIRWLASLVSGFSVLGFFWIIWQREKRGWHDLLARTWVVREWTRVSTNV